MPDARASHCCSWAARCIVAVLVLAGCSGDDGGTAATTSTAVIASTQPRVDDGEFVLGVVTPSVGMGAEIGQSVRAGVQLAVNDVNQAGGIDGQRVRVVRRDEGDSPADALRVVQDLVEAGADAIVGPTSSVDLLGSLRAAVDSGVLTCSPTASALALDEFPDEGLLLRTAPSDALEARALAQVVDESGADRAVVLYLDDPFGRPFAEEVQAALVAQGTTVASAIGFTESEDRIAAVVDEVVALDPTMIVVIADDDAGPLVIEAIESAMGSERPSYVVNDAMRRPGETAEPFSGAIATRVEGASPIAYADSRFFTDGLAEVDVATTGVYAANAFDCVNLIALAGAATGTAQPAVIAAAIPAVSSGGTTCSSFPRCAEALADGRNINYDSPAGALDIGADGDPSKAAFERFTFDIFGRDVGGRILTVSRG